VAESPQRSCRLYVNQSHASQRHQTRQRSTARDSCGVAQPPTLRPVYAPASVLRRRTVAAIQRGCRNSSNSSLCLPESASSDSSMGRQHPSSRELLRRCRPREASKQATPGHGLSRFSSSAQRPSKISVRYSHILQHPLIAEVIPYMQVICGRRVSSYTSWRNPRLERKRPFRGVFLVLW